MNDREFVDYYLSDEEILLPNEAASSTASSADPGKIETSAEFDLEMVDAEYLKEQDDDPFDMEEVFEDDDVISAAVVASAPSAETTPQIPQNASQNTEPLYQGTPLQQAPHQQTPHQGETFQQAQYQGAPINQAPRQAEVFQQDPRQAPHQPENSRMHASYAPAQAPTQTKSTNQSFYATPILVPTPGAVGRSQVKTWKRSIPKIIAIVLAAIILLALAIFFFIPWDRVVSVNGQEFSARAHSTLVEVAEEMDIKTKPGNLLAIDNSLLQEGGGKKYSFIVNGEPQPNDDYEVAQGDVIEITDGGDVIEDFTEEEILVYPPISIEGVGAVHLYTDTGSTGKAIRKTGNVSGLVTEEVIEEPAIRTLQNLNVHTDDKVIALTFDDGPWANYTQQILDILAQNDAKATFFTVGDRVQGMEDIVKAASDAGHQICTHSWDHAAGSGQGVNLDYMTDDEQRMEISEGQRIIEEATGKEASKVVRVPGGNLSENTAKILQEFATSEIGWNIDTTDWKRPGADHIESLLLQAQPGNIILMHDGGGDRSQTVEALSRALPQLKEQGYRFITIDELIDGYVQQ